MDRKEAIEKLLIMQCKYRHIRKNDDEWEAIETAIEALQESERETGKWIYQKDGKVTCSACGAESKTGEVKVLRMIGLPTKFSRNFIKTLKEMMADVPESTEAYRTEVSNYQKNYTIDQLVSYSNPGCKLKEC